MANLSSLSAKNTHDLWVEARQFQLDIRRTSPTTVELTVTYPTDISTVDGAVVLFNTSPIGPSNYPEDGQQYQASLDFSAPVQRVPEPNGAPVVAFYSGILSNPLPGIADPNTGRSTFTLEVTGLSASAIYYASIHPSSNVLQYYPIGIQSYPLESSRIEKDSTSYTGNIPSLPAAPVSPSNNMVYYDTNLGVVQYWTGSAWIPTRTDAIISGPTNPGTLGQTYYYNAGVQLRIFDGVNWVVATGTNLQLRQGMSWIPLAKVSSGTKIPETPAPGDFFYNWTIQRGQYWDGTSWIYPSSANTLFTGGSAPTPAFITPLTAEPELLPAPHLGQLFYNTTQQVLNVWTGTSWEQANTDQEGTPTTDKISIGTDGSYDERVRLIQVIKGEMGWPTQCLELKEEHFNIAIDNALETYRQLSDNAYRTQYVLMRLIEGQQLYYLNDPVSKTDHIVSVTKIHRLNILGAESLSWDSNIYFQTFLNQYYTAGYTDMLSIHMLHSLSEDFRRLFAGDLMFTWNEATRELFIARKLARAEQVVMECVMERTEQEIVLDRYAKQFIQNYAIAEVKMILGLIRSKYTSGTPGAAGPINLNGEMLITEARQDLTELREQLLNNEFGSGGLNHGNCSFLIG